MSLNQFMHPRNPYRKAPDFKELSEKYAYFKEQVTTDEKGGIHLNFKEPSALRALSQSLLERDFSLKVELPDDRLVPTIPLRLNYLLWIEDILTANKRFTNIKGIDIGTGASCVYPLLAARKNSWRLLATEINEFSADCAKRNVSANNLNHLIKVHWIKDTSASLLNDEILEQFKIDEVEAAKEAEKEAEVDNTRTVTEAENNTCGVTEAENNTCGVTEAENTTEENVITHEELRSHIENVADHASSPSEVAAICTEPPPSGEIEEDEEEGEGTCLADFCVCNPPFYASNLDSWAMLDEPRKKRRKLNMESDCSDNETFVEDESVDRPHPHSVSTAAPDEAVTPGGEVAFVKRLIEDSVRLREKVRIYTTMLGKKSSLIPIKKILKDYKIMNYATHELCQGRTMRWTIAWSFIENINLQVTYDAKRKKTKMLLFPIDTDKLSECVEVSDDIQDDLDLVLARLKNILNELLIVHTIIRPKQTSGSVLRLRAVAKLETWRNQRNKRRHLDHIVDFGSALSPPLNFNVDLIPCPEGGAVISAQFEFISGPSNEMMHRVMQCIRNKVYVKDEKLAA